MHSSTTDTRPIRKIRICETIRMVKTVKHGIALVFATTCVLFAFAAAAATTVTIDSVSQRWPWNNKIDITYTVTGGQDLSTSNFCKLVFTTDIAGTIYTIDGVTNVGASVNSDTHTVTWTAPSGVRSDNCTISASIYKSDTPSGDEYMVIDLNTGLVSYEGMLANQEASNGRYNTDIYKTDKMVLRKIPAGGPYPTGDSVNYPTSNSPTNRITRRDYYIGVFPVTQAQYKKICGAEPSTKIDPIEGNNVDHRPVEGVKWKSLRGTLNPLEAITPMVSGNSFFQRLNGLTLARSGISGFDLPTEIMFEIAQRAGVSGTYAWEGSSFNTDYAVTKETSGNSTVAVGSRLSNDWGLYDTTGNVLEWCLDSVTAASGVGANPSCNLSAVADPFTPNVEGASDTYRVCRGGGVWKNNANSWCHASNRYVDTPESGRNATGFRIAIVMD